MPAGLRSTPGPRATKLGATVDLAEAYAWSWEEIARLRAEQAGSAA